MIATGQITIVDTNDARPITAYMSASDGVQQVYSKENDTSTFIPSWFSANSNAGNYIEPAVYVGGPGAATEVTHILSNRKFTLSPNGSALTTGAAPSQFVDNSYGTSGITFTVTNSPTVTRLAIKGNLKETVGQYVIYFEGDYTDPATGLTTHIITSISLNTVKTGTNATWINVRGKNIITESDTGTKNTAVIACDLVRSSGVDTSNLIFKFYENNGANQITTGTSGVATKYGFSLTATGASPVAVAMNTAIPLASGSANNTLTISENAITDIGVFKVTVTDTVDSVTWETWFTIFDVTDPYEVRILSSTGDKLQNGQGNTVLTPSVFNGSSLVSSLTGWTFDWYYYDRSGKRGAFIDTTKIPTPGGASITANTSGNSAVFTYSGTNYAANFAAGNIIKCVKPDGTAFFYEVASVGVGTITIRNPSTNTWLSFTSFPAPSAVGDFVGGKIYGCHSSLQTAAAAGLTVTGDDIDVKGTINVEANRP
jgi:hypothetical protein